MLSDKPNKARMMEEMRNFMLVQSVSQIGQNREHNYGASGEKLSANESLFWGAQKSGTRETRAPPFLSQRNNPKK
jgi:hypothetical protein